MPATPGGEITMGELRRALAQLPAPDEEFCADLDRIRAEQPQAVFLRPLVPR